MSKYVPERFDVILLDFEPKKGNEIGKYRPALVLSSKTLQSKNGSSHLLSYQHQYSRAFKRGVS